MEVHFQFYHPWPVVHWMNNNVYQRNDMKSSNNPSIRLAGTEACTHSTQMNGHGKGLNI